MSKKKYSFNLGDVDYDKLHTDSDFRREVQRLLPDAMKQMGEKVAEGVWDEAKKAFGLNNSEKSKFIRDAQKKYENDSEQKKDLGNHLFDELKSEKKKHSS